MDTNNCRYCDGQGKVQASIGHGTEPDIIDCRECGGSGKALVVVRKRAVAPDVGGLTCYDHRGCLMVPDPSGDYCNIADVRALLATKAAAEAAPQQAVPEEVRSAVERMCKPLDESRLGGATAEADARCMATIKQFIDSLDAAPAEQPSTPVPRVGGNTSGVLKTWPEHIWLQWNPDELEEFPGASEDLTWCDHRIHRTDVEYVRSDLAHVARQPVAAPSPAAAQEGEQGSVLAEPYAYEHDNGTCSELIYAAWFKRHEMIEGDIYRPLYLAAPSSTEASTPAAPADGAMARYRFLLSFLLDRGVLHQYGNGIWRLRGIYGVDDSGLKGAGRTPEEALDNAIVAANLDPVAADKFWSASCERVLAAPADLRDAALEEAAKACEAESIVQQETYMSLAEGDVAYNLAIAHCVSAIRALRSASTPEDDSQKGGAA